MTQQNLTKTELKESRYNGARRAARGFLAAFVGIAALTVSAENPASQAATPPAKIAQIAQIAQPAAQTVIPAQAGISPVIPAQAGISPVIPAQAGISPVIPAQAGIHLRDSGAFSTPRRFAGGGESAKALSGGGIRPKTPPATLPSANSHPPLAMQAGGKKPVIPAQVSRAGGNDEGLSFADYYKQEQARLLSALDNALSQKAEEALLNEFTAIQKAEVQLQTNLGGRKGNVGINILGAFSQTESRAIGWQFRAYGGEDRVKGANAGVFYRGIIGGDNTLWGLNAFADHENGVYGDFTRYSVGGELRHRYLSFAGNYYFSPRTEEKRVNSTVVAFSRRGYDAKMRVNLPMAGGVKAAVDYYHFDGKHGAKEEKGFRYGMEVQPSPNFRLGWFYDEGSRKFGGDVAFSHIINSNSSSFPRRRESITDFSPDLFAAVSREYSQRIATVADPRITPPMTTTRITPPMTTTRITPQMTITTRVTTAGVTTTITVPGMTTTMTVSMTTFPPFARAASVNATVRHDFLPANNINRTYVAITREKFLVTLPMATENLPHTRVVAGSVLAGKRAFLLESSDGNPAVGSESALLFLAGYFAFQGGGSRVYTATIVQGSEELVPTVTMSMTTTLENPQVITEMVTGGVTTTTRTTTFATTTITLAANAATTGESAAAMGESAAATGESAAATGERAAAMGEMPPLSSSFPLSLSFPLLLSFAGKQESPKPNGACPKGDSRCRGNDGMMDSRQSGNDGMMDSRQSGNDGMMNSRQSGNDGMMNSRQSGNDGMVDSRLRGNDGKQRIPAGFIPAAAGTGMTKFVIPA